MCIRDRSRTVDTGGFETPVIVVRSASTELEANDGELITICLLYTSDAADDLLCVDLGGRRIIKKKTTRYNSRRREDQQ